MNFLLRECEIVGDGGVTASDVRVRDGRIAQIGSSLNAAAGERVVEGGGRLLFPGAIDDQVHFREPGLTHKADIASESRAAAAGGVTSFMEMPNVQPPTLDMQRLEEKRAIAAVHSCVNYAFYLGASNDNLAAIAAADPRRIAGIKIFMGASTGDMLVDDEVVLRRIFEVAPTLIATHCESSPRIRNNLQKAQNLYGANIPAAMHPIIRNAAVCYDSSSLAVSLARETGARLHILHLTTAQEMELFAPGPLDNKHITAEACAHHLLFDESDYVALGMRLKTNPAVKSRADREALHLALAEGRIDVLATDHAPHLPAEKDQPYIQAAAGMPLVEYALPAYLELVADGVLTYAQVATKAAGAVADIFSIRERGYIREGYYADLVLVEKTPAGTPARKAVLSKCGWTPFADYRFRHSVHSTYVNGHLVWNEEEIQERVRGMALEFDR